MTGDVTEEVPGRTSSVREAVVKAGKILARRAHSEHELRSKLSAHFATDVVEGAMARLSELGLVDDAAFAEQWVSERADRKGSLVLLAELEEKGVAADVAEEAVRRCGSELPRALEIAHRQLRKVLDKPLPSQVASIRGALLRRGFEMEIVDEATRAVLPPEGWD